MLIKNPNLGFKKTWGYNLSSKRNNISNKLYKFQSLQIY